MTGLVITGTQLERIKSSTEQGIIISNPSSLTHELDVDLHRKSLARVSRWDNTVEATRAHRAKLKAEDQITREAELSRIDREEAVFQEKKRGEAIGRANQILKRQSDRMKVFSSGMMLSDVLAERENQIEIKEQLQRLENIRQIKYDELVKHNVHMMNEREARESEESKKKHLLVAKSQKKQLEDARLRRLSEIANAEEERRLIRARDERYIAAELERKKVQRQAALRARSETLRAQTYLNEIKARERDMDEQEDALIAKYAAEKEEIAERRRHREEFVFHEKQKTRQKLIDLQAAKLEQLRDNEEGRITQQCRDAEVEEIQRLAESAARIKEWKAEIEMDRRDQINKKNRDREEKLLREQKASEFARLVFEKIEDDEMQEAVERREAAKRLSKDLLTQIEIKKAIAADEIKTQSEILERAKRAVNRDANDFQSYCEEYIREYAENGKNVIPLIQALKSFHSIKNA